ncbi:hypothetical protein SRHO_G00324260 [Serrasalmus rhombeus]
MSAPALHSRSVLEIFPVFAANFSRKFELYCCTSSRTSHEMDGDCGATRADGNWVFRLCTASTPCIPCPESTSTDEPLHTALAVQHVSLVRD